MHSQCENSTVERLHNYDYHLYSYHPVFLCLQLFDHRWSSARWEPQRGKRQTGGSIVELQWKNSVPEKQMTQWLNLSHLSSPFLRGHQQETTKFSFHSEQPRFMQKMNKGRATSRNRNKLWPLLRYILKKNLAGLMSCGIKQSKSNMPLRGLPEGQNLGLVTSSMGNGS